MKMIQDVQSVKFGLTNSEPLPGKGICYVYENDRNESLVIRQGDLMTNKKGRKYKFVRRYKVSENSMRKETNFTATSKDQAYDFNVNMAYTIKITDPIMYIKYGNDPIIDLVTDKLSREAIRLARDYNLEEYAKLEDTLKAHLSELEELKDMGISLGIDATVAQNEEVRSRRKKQVQRKNEHDDDLLEIDLQREKKEKLLEGLSDILEGTYYAPLITLYDDPQKLKQHLLKEFMEHMEERKQTTKKLKYKYIEEQLDDIDYENKLTRINRTFNSAEIVTINQSVKQLESKVEQNYSQSSFGSGDRDDDLLVEEEDNNGWN